MKPLQMLSIFNWGTDRAHQTFSWWYLKHKAMEMSWLLIILLKMDFFPFSPLISHWGTQCGFHYLSSYCKNVYFTLLFFSNACYYLGVHLNDDLTAYHFHMLEHILKCLLKGSVLNTSHITLQQGCLLIIIHIKSCFLCAANTRKGKKLKLYRFFEI